MLSHDHKCIFVHIPKAAGQSIEQAFLDLLGLTWETRSALLLRPNDDPAKGPVRLAHLIASEYISCGHISESDFKRYFKFSFVRNPWTRVVSSYLFCEFDKKYDFKTFIFKHMPKPEWSAVYRHYLPQYDYLYDDEGNCLVDFVGKFETLQADFDIVCRKLSIPQHKVPYRNKTSDKKNTTGKKGLILDKLSQQISLLRKKPVTTSQFKNYTDYYDSESIEYIATLYKKDIETFGYEFGK